MPEASIQYFQLCKGLNTIQFLRQLITSCFKTSGGFYLKFSVLLASKRRKINSRIVNAQRDEPP